MVESLLFRIWCCSGSSGSDSSQAYYHLPLYSHRFVTCISPNERAHVVVGSCGTRGGERDYRFPSIHPTEILAHHTCFHANFPNPNKSCNPRAARRYPPCLSASIESNPFPQLILSFPGACVHVPRLYVRPDWASDWVVGWTVEPLLQNWTAKVASSKCGTHHSSSHSHPSRFQFHRSHFPFAVPKPGSPSLSFFADFLRSDTMCFPRSLSFMSSPVRTFRCSDFLLLHLVVAECQI